MKVEPKFYKNEDNKHCLQAVLLMVFNSLLGEVSLEEVNMMTEYNDKLYSWSPRAAVSVNKKIEGVKLFSGLDYREFVKKGEEYLRNYMPSNWFEDQKAHASGNFIKEQAAARDCVSGGIFEYYPNISKDLLSRLLEKFILVAVVNPYTLYSEDGVAGHFVLVYGELNNDFLIHDPGLPAQRSWHISKDIFMNAFKNEIIAIPKLDIPFGIDIGQNQKCFCKSGKKYKKCHGK